MSIKTWPSITAPEALDFYLWKLFLSFWPLEFQMVIVIYDIVFLQPWPQWKLKVTVSNCTTSRNQISNSTWVLPMGNGWVIANRNHLMVRLWEWKRYMVRLQTVSKCYTRCQSEIGTKTWIMIACRLEMIQSVFLNKGPLDLTVSHLPDFHIGGNSALTSIQDKDWLHPQWSIVQHDKRWH